MGDGEVPTGRADAAQLLGTQEHSAPTSGDAGRDDGMGIVVNATRQWRRWRRHSSMTDRLRVGIPVGTDVDGVGVPSRPSCGAGGRGDGRFIKLLTGETDQVFAGE